VAGVQAICDGLTEPVIDALLRKWLARLPHPFTAANRAAGYRYQLSVLQAEFSLTQMLDKPVSGRIFFEQTIRDNLDIGRPDQVSLIFNRQVRRNTRNLRTRVITDTVIPNLHVDYKYCRTGFTHRDLRTHLAPQLGLPPEQMTSAQITYDLRRLRTHGLIQRILTPTDTRSPAKACATPYSSPAPTTGS
jgi:hypothetical protein